MTKTVQIAGSVQTSPYRLTKGERVFVLAVLLAVVATGIWAYWATLGELIKEWRRNPDYSVGQLVPLVALYLVWHDRARLRATPWSPSGWGVVLILLAQALRIYGLLFLLQSVDRYALVLTIMGLVLLLAGRAIWWQTRWILLFLLLMVPLPGRLHNAISGPLQHQATTGAVFLLELSGVTVAREGNVIVLNDSVPLAVAEACSGLRMLTAFVVVAAAFAGVVRRPLWKRAVLLVSSVPVAIICNLARLYATAGLILLAQTQWAQRFFHDFAGLTMMPLAVLILAGELVLMDTIAPDPQTSPSPADGRLHRPKKAAPTA